MSHQILSRLLRKIDFELKDLKMKEKVELGMNGIVLTGKKAKPAPVNDLVSICAPPQIFRPSSTPTSKNGNFQLNYMVKNFLEKEETKRKQEMLLRLNAYMKVDLKFRISKSTELHM